MHISNPIVNRLMKFERFHSVSRLMLFNRGAIYYLTAANDISMIVISR